MVFIPGVITNHQKLVMVALILLALNEGWMFTHYADQQDDLWDWELSYVYPEYKEEWHVLDALMAQHWRNLMILCSGIAFFSVFSVESGNFTLKYLRKVTFYNNEEEKA